MCKVEKHQKGCGKEIIPFASVLWLWWEGFLGGGDFLNNHVLNHAVTYLMKEFWIEFELRILPLNISHTWCPSGVSLFLCSIALGAIRSSMWWLGTAFLPVCFFSIPTWLTSPWPSLLIPLPWLNFLPRSLCPDGKQKYASVSQIASLQPSDMGRRVGQTILFLSVRPSCKAVWYAGEMSARPVATWHQICLELAVWSSCLD